MDLIHRFVAWVRKGYPAGVPEQDYIALLALARRRLTDQEIESLRTELEERGIAPAQLSDVSEGIQRRTDQVPSDAEISRVAEHLRAAGVELDDPELNAEVDDADASRPDRAR